MIVRSAAEIDPAWSAIPLFWDRFGDYNFFFWHPGVSVALPAENSPLGPKDSAMLAVLEASVPAINQQIAASILRSRNAPPPAPPDPDSKRFWRVKVDWSLDTDQDGCADWAEFEIAARGTGMSVPGVVGDAFDPDTNNDGIPDGKQLDADGDGTPDVDDPDPDDDTASFPIIPIPRYALFPITNTVTNYWADPIRISDRGTVLFYGGTWAGGVWTPLSASSTQVAGAWGRTINDNDVIAGLGDVEVKSSGDSETEWSQGLCYWPSPSAQPFAMVSSGMSDYGWLGDTITEDGVTTSPTLSNTGKIIGLHLNWRTDDDGSSYDSLGNSIWTVPTTAGAAPLPGIPDSETHWFGDNGITWCILPRDGNGNINGLVKMNGQDLPELSYIPLNVLSTPNGVLALRSRTNAGLPLAFVNDAWKECPLYQHAFDMSTDGTAVGTAHGDFTAPILINGKWTDIKRAPPIPTDTFDPPPPWHGNDVSFMDTTPGGWILAKRDVLPVDFAVMLPIRAEGYYQKTDGTSITEAVGVDDFSIGSETPGVEVQDKIWIMAPQGGFNKIVKFKSPLNANTPVNLSASNILFGGQESTTISGAISPVVLRAADTVLSGGERVMTLTMGSGSNEVSSISKPIGLKIMKGRTVKVTVYKVTKIYGAAAEDEVDEFMMPTQEEIANHLKDIFRPQVNSVFNVNLVEEPLKVRWDSDNNSAFDIQTGTGDPGEEAAILAKVPANPEPYDIRVFLVANLSAPLGSGIDAYGLTLRDQRTCWVLGSKTGKNRNKSYLLDTIAHEIGHVLVGEGHPDKTTGNPGPAPLPGTKHTCRLMCSGPNSDGSSRLLVKKEWDAAEKWLKERERQRELGN